VTVSERRNVQGGKTLGSLGRILNGYAETLDWVGGGRIPYKVALAPGEGDPCIHWQEALRWTAEIMAEMLMRKIILLG
jgi:hypothetical protein